MNSKSELGIQFADYYAGLFWHKYEFNNDRLQEFSQLDNVHHSVLFNQENS